jgi:hypothetical protein
MSVKEFGAFGTSNTLGTPQPNTREEQERAQARVYELAFADREMVMRMLFQPIRPVAVNPDGSPKFRGKV